MGKKYLSTNLSERGDEIKEEFSLSEKKWKNTDVGGPYLGEVIWEKDVKEFIKKETELINKAIETGNWRGFWFDRTKLAGDDLK